MGGCRGGGGRRIGQGRGCGGGGGGMGGGGGAFSCVYRNDLSLDLKQTSDSAVTTSWGRLYQSGMVLGKNDICLNCVLQDIIISCYSKLRLVGILTFCLLNGILEYIIIMVNIILFSSAACIGLASFRQLPHAIYFLFPI